jgi:nucleotide-binding universal stress UspA family protein
MAGKILVPIDGSDHGWRALDMAVELARGRDAEIVVFHAMRYEPLPNGLKEFAKVEGINLLEENALFHSAREIGDALTRSGETRVREAGYDSVSTRGAEGRPARAIVDAAEAVNADMIVMGSRGLSDAAGLLLGSVSHRVSHLAPCTCVLVK